LSGGRLGQHLPAELLLAGFAAVMFVAAVGMLRDRPPPTARPSPVIVVGAAVALWALVAAAYAVTRRDPRHRRA
jgi:uncharacterized membrane protein YfcA